MFFHIFQESCHAFAVKSEPVDGFGRFLDQKTPCEKVEGQSDVLGTLKHEKNRKIQKKFDVCNQFKFWNPFRN